MLEGRTDSGRLLEVVSPSDTDNFTKFSHCRRIYVGTGGDVSLHCIDDTDVVIPDVPSGFYIDCYATRVNAAGTTAAGMVAFS